MSEKLFNYASSDNIAKNLKDKELNKIVTKVLRDFSDDEAYQEEFISESKKIIDLAKLKTKPKNYPMPKSSNVTYPIIARTVLNAASNIKSELVREQKVVGSAVIGKDSDEIKAKFAKWKSDFLNYKLLFDQSINWKEGLERSLNLCFTIGVAYKKLYYDPIKKSFNSELCDYDEVFVCDNEKPLKEQKRMSHKQMLYTNTLLSHARSGIFTKLTDAEYRLDSDDDEECKHEVIEQHCFLDLDGDGYQEPYIVTVHKESEKILRIVARYSYNDITFNAKGEVIHIEPECYFVKIPCLVPPDGKSHYMGFGNLLYSLNKSVNTGINQLIDAGTLSNTQTGFISKSMGLKDREVSIAHGKYKVVDLPYDADFRKGIYDLNFKEPSAVLFQLMTLLDQSAKDLSSATDFMMGSNLPHNAKTGAVSEMVNRGMKVYTSVQERIFKAIEDEINIISRLYYKNLNVQEYREVLDDPELNQIPDEVILEYFNPKNNDIKLVADPRMSSDTQRMQQAQVIMQVQQMYPFIDQVEAARRQLQAANIPDIDKLIDPQKLGEPNQQEKELNLEAQNKQAEMQLKLQEEQRKNQELQIRYEKEIRDTAEKMEKLKVEMEKIRSNEMVKMREIASKERIAKDKGDSNGKGSS